MLVHAERYGIPALCFGKSTFAERPVEILDALIAHSIGYIVLAGFLLKVPDTLVHHYAGRVLNIHPSLLPAYGGQGMYGDHVHRAVLAAGEKQTGITIHLVNEHYDEGEILLQWKVPVLSSDSLDSLRQRVLSAEHYWYPLVLMRILMETFPER